MKTKINTITLTVLTALLFTACESFLDAFPQDQITDNNFWKTENDAQKMLIDIYSATLPSSTIFWMETMSDNAYLTWDWWGGYQQIANGTNTTYGGTGQDVWNARYECVRKCWFLLENIDKVPFTNDNTKEQIIAETRFLLAYSYHILAAYFGDIPLVKKTMSLEESKQLVRDSKETVITFIIEELDKAATVLRSKDMEWGRVTWGACQALKARVYLYQNNYPRVLETVETLKGKYSLNTVGATPYEDLILRCGRTQR